jgi:hypothetical protein
MKAVAKFLTVALVFIRRAGTSTKHHCQHCRIISSHQYDGDRPEQELGLQIVECGFIHEPGVKSIVALRDFRTLRQGVARMKRSAIRAIRP